MRITWKDGITTLVTIVGMLLERAYFDNWDLPLVSNIHWVILGMAGLTAIALFFSYVLDHAKSKAWNVAAAAFAFATVILSGLGLVFANSNYIILLMMNMVAFWVASIVRHTADETSISQTHAS